MQENQIVSEMAEEVLERQAKALAPLGPLTRAREDRCSIGGMAIRSYERFLELPVPMVLSVVWLVGSALPGLALVGLWVLLAHVAG
jgi:hypothetical protein